MLFYFGSICPYVWYTFLFLYWMGFISSQLTFFEGLLFNYALCSSTFQIFNPEKSSSISLSFCSLFCWGNWDPEKLICFRTSNLVVVELVSSLYNLQISSACPVELGSSDKYGKVPQNTEGCLLFCRIIKTTLEWITHMFSVSLSNMFKAK